MTTDFDRGETLAQRVEREIDELLLGEAHTEDWSQTSAQVIQTDEHTCWVELAVRVTNECSHCGQSLGQAGPVVWMARKGGDGPGSWWEPNGMHSQQHGCGEWNTPVHVDGEISERSGPATVSDQIGLLHDLLVAEENRARADLVEDTKRSVARAHLLTLNALCDGDASRLVPGGEQSDPGTAVDGGVLATWAWNPTDPNESICTESTRIKDLSPIAQQAIAKWREEQG